MGKTFDPIDIVFISLILIYFAALIFAISFCVYKLLKDKNNKVNVIEPKPINNDTKPIIKTTEKSKNTIVKSENKDNNSKEKIKNTNSQTKKKNIKTSTASNTQKKKSTTPTKKKNNSTKRSNGYVSPTKRKKKKGTQKRK